MVLDFFLSITSLSFSLDLDHEFKEFNPDSRRFSQL